VPRPVRALLALAVAVALVGAGSGTSGADEGGEPDAYGVVNNIHRQQLLHRHWPTDGVPGSIIVTASTTAAAEAVADAEGGLRVGARAVLLHVEPGTEAANAGRIAGRGGVVDVEPDRVRELARVPNDPRFDEQWSHDVSRATTAWSTTTGDADVVVAVLDTGIDGRHPDLRNNIVEQVDLSSGRLVTRTLGSDNDTCNVGHGTFVAGVLGAEGDNGKGVAGVAWDVSIVDVALTSHASRCGILDSAIIAGLDYVVHRSPHDDAVNHSLAAIAHAGPTALQDDLHLVREGGTLVVAAAGNDEQRVPGATSIPASCNGVLSVGAVGDASALAPYSDENPYVDIAAPGGDSSTGEGIVSTTAGGGDTYGVEEGTSFAAPYVAGVAALLLSVEPDLTPDDLESILERTARDRGTPGRDSQYGWGVVDAAAAVAAADDAVIADPTADASFPVAAGGESIERVAPIGTTTLPAAQAVAVSKQAFDALSASHAVIARTDGFADALAGSSLGFGIGPLLFTKPTGPLAGVTRTELQRVLEPGSTVYLLGGTAALPSTLEGEIRALGFEPVRLAGVNRYETSAAIAEEHLRSLRDQDFQVPDRVIVATGANWPDAVTAGSLGAYFGLPILVTDPADLAPSVASVLSGHDWSKVYVIGGTAAISDDTRRAVRDAAGLATGDVPRLAGTNRSSTAVAVATEFERLFSEQFESFFGEPAVPNVVAAVNVRRADGFAHVLSATALVGEYAGVFVPVEGDGGTSIQLDAQQYACRFPAAGFVMGGTDVIDADTASLFDDVLRGDAPACH
jgi:subtilisin family serine protease